MPGHYRSVPGPPWPLRWWLVVVVAVAVVGVLVVVVARFVLQLVVIVVVVGAVVVSFGVVGHQKSMRRCLQWLGRFAHF